MKCISKKSGFTLAELMVVVAILGILVTISIVVFGNHSGESEKAVCDANKTALMQHMDMEEVNGLELIPTVASAGDLDAMLVKAEASMESWKCPSGGEYTIAYRDSHDPNSWYIHCDVHDGEASGVLPVLGDNGEIVRNLIDKVNNSDVTGNVDSTAYDGKVYSDYVLDVLELTKELGVDKNSGLLTSWKFTRNQEFLFSTIDISQKKEEGEYVPVLRYNNNAAKEDFYKTFTVWLCKIEEKTSTVGVNFNGIKVYNAQYMTFSSSTRKEVTAQETGLTVTDKKDYNKMKGIYDKVCAEYEQNSLLIQAAATNTAKMKELQKKIGLIK